MKRTLRQRWDRVREVFTLEDMSVISAGNVLMALGAGALAAHALAPYGWWLVGGGILLIGLIKMKYWRRFWS